MNHKLSGCIIKSALIKSALNPMIAIVCVIALLVSGCQSSSIQQFVIQHCDALALNTCALAFTTALFVNHRHNHPVPVALLLRGNHNSKILPPVRNLGVQKLPMKKKDQKVQVVSPGAGEDFPSRRRTRRPSRRCIKPGRSCCRIRWPI